MQKTKIQQLDEFGQSIWLDYISRSLIDSGRLKQMIDMGLKGMTSNPTIFDKAISASNDYDERIRELRQQDMATFNIYDELTIRDIQNAADMFRPIYEKSNRRDGYVSLEINPKLAMKTKETIEEGKRLYKKVNRPNVMFKVPSTDAGFPAIEELIAGGININITLIFSVEQYTRTAQAYLKGMKRLLQKGGELSHIGSVASVFVSRIDTAVDNLLEEKIKREGDSSKKERLKNLCGKAAVAYSSLIHHKYIEIFSDREFKRLQQKGANVQRLLWGSTSTKNPAYSDIKYVTELIAKNTINTIPENTLNAFLDHGVVKEVLTGDTKMAQRTIHDLEGFGVDLGAVCRKLLQDGVSAFEKSFDSLLASIEEKVKCLCD